MMSFHRGPSSPDEGNVAIIQNTTKASEHTAVRARSGSLSDIDRKVKQHLRLVRRRPDGDETFDGRTPDQVIHSGGSTLPRFQKYRGAAKSCAKARAAARTSQSSSG
jgi:hypothetical protein